MIVLRNYGHLEVVIEFVGLVEEGRCGCVRWRTVGGRGYSDGAAESMFPMASETVEQSCLAGSCFELVVIRGRERERER